MVREDKNITDDMFNDIKVNAIKIWSTYPDEHGYRSSKINRIAYLENDPGNALYIYGMFDQLNKAKLLHMVKKETKKLLTGITSPERME